MKTTFVVMFVLGVFVLTGCGLQMAPNTSAGSAANDTARLDDMARDNPAEADFAHAVESFYQAIEKQDWPSSYDLRVAEFRQDVPKDTYLKTMAEDGKDLHVNHYEILTVTMFHGPAGGVIAAEMILRFDENGNVVYGSSRWKKRNGVWLCDEPGLDESLLKSTRAPEWIAN